MKYRKLRIAWSVTWGIAAVLIVVFWIRGYRNYERFVGPNQRFIVDVNKRLFMISTYPMMVPQLESKPFFVRRPYGVAIAVPISLPILVACAASIAPWVFIASVSAR